jgi:MYXO-CTERM domain-containing protein
MRVPFWPLFALGVCSSPVIAGSVLFSDLGPPGDVYVSGSGSAAAGSGSNIGNSVTTAELFTSAGSGTFSVTQIDLAVGNVEAPDTFYASIWSDDAGLPGTEVADAYWSLSTSASFGTCCALVAVSGITGVSLTGGQQYFMILGPLSLSDDSENAWNYNNQGAASLDLYSTNGGSTWVYNGVGPTGAFDIDGTSTSEPGSPVLLGTGLIGLLGVAARRRLHRA